MFKACVVCQKIFDSLSIVYAIVKIVLHGNNAH